MSGREGFQIHRTKRKFGQSEYLRGRKSDKSEREEEIVLHVRTAEQTGKKFLERMDCAEKERWMQGYLLSGSGLLSR